MMKMVYFGVTLFILHLFSKRQVLGEKSEKLTQHEYLGEKLFNIVLNTLTDHALVYQPEEG